MEYLYLLLALLANFFCILLISLRYTSLFNLLEEHLSLFNAFKLVGITQLISYLTPFNLGILLGRPFIAKHLSGIPPAKTILATIFDQFLELFWQGLILISLILIGGFSFFKPQTPSPFFILMIIIGVFAIFSFLTYNYFLNKLIFHQQKIPHWIRIVIGKFVTIKDLVTLSNIFKKRKSIHQFFFVYSVLIVFFIILYPSILYFTTLAFNTPLHYWTVFGLTWASYLAGRLSGIPGGLGTRDVTLGAALSLLGVSVGQASLITLTYRIITFLPSLLTTLLYGTQFLPSLRRKPKQKFI